MVVVADMRRGKSAAMNISPVLAAVLIGRVHGLTPSADLGLSAAGTCSTDALPASFARSGSQMSHAAQEP
jgi:hypothetical protein